MVARLPPPSADLPSNTVLLNVYDIVAWNAVLAAVGVGVHHTGVQVYGVEIAYGRTPQPGTGVFTMTPRKYPPHRFVESLAMGQTRLSPAAVGAIAKQLSREWLGHEYHLIRKNCNAFANVLLRLLLAPNADTLAAAAATGGVPRPLATAPPSDGSPASSAASSLRPEECYTVRRVDVDQIYHGHGKARESLPPGIDDGGRVVGAPAWTNRIARLAEQWLPERWLAMFDDSDRQMQQGPPSGAASAGSPATTGTSSTTR